MEGDDTWHVEKFILVEVDEAEKGEDDDGENDEGGPAAEVEEEGNDDSKDEWRVDELTHEK